MKKSCSLLLLLLFSFAAFTQDITAIQKLTDQFGSVYHASLPKTNSYYEALVDATKITLNPDNIVFRDAWKEMFLKTDTIHTTDQKIQFLFDSILIRFLKDGFWKQDSPGNTLISVPLRLYVANMCPCITSHVSGTLTTSALVSASDACEQIAMADTGFMNEFRKSIQPLSPAEQQQTQVLMSKYLYQHCSVYYKIANDVLIGSVKQNVYEFVYNAARDLIPGVARMVKNNKADSLKSIFPDHIKYKQGIDKSVKINLQGSAFITRKEKSNSPETFIQVTTYYKGAKPAVLLGQVRITYHTRGLLPLISALNFIEPAMIVNKADILKEIEEDRIPEPPPQMKNN